MHAIIHYCVSVESFISVSLLNYIFRIFNLDANNI